MLFGTPIGRNAARRTVRTIIQDNDFNTRVETEPSVIVRGIAKDFNVSHTAVMDGLKRIGKVKKLGRCLRNEGCF